MRKLISVFLVFLICYTMTGCLGGESEYLGSYTRVETCWFPPELVGTDVLVLESNGTGTYTHTLTYDRYGWFGVGTTIMEGDVSWEVVDDVVYVQASLSGERSKEINLELRLEGKTLVSCDSPNIRYVKN